MKMKGAVVEGIVAVAIIIASTLIVVNMLNSSMKESETYSNLNKAKETMTFLDTAIRELAAEAPGARRTIQVLSDFGTFTVDGEGDKVKFFMEGGAPVLEPGNAVKEGNLITVSGPSMSAYEKDVNGDGTMDYVLENDAVLFAVRKVGSATSPASINMSNAITLIRNKRAGVNITPVASIYMDDDPANSFGTGFTTLSIQGTAITSSSVRVYVNSSVKEYDAIFTLRSAEDFIDLEVKNIKSK